MNYAIKAHTLNEAWLEACRLVFAKGIDLKYEQKQKEVTNLNICISNSFENEHDIYFKYFSKNTFDQVLKVYSKGGSKELKKDYWSRIYNNNGVDQIKRVVSILKEDPSSKSATVLLSDITKEKQPCVMDVNLRIRSELVEMTVVFKSSDIAKKFIPDIVVLSGIHESISRQLHLGRGQTYIYVLSAQIHEPDFPAVKKLIQTEKPQHYYDAEKAIQNWNGDAEEWDKKVEDPKHYVNIGNGYKRFLDFAQTIAREHITKNQIVLDLGCGTGIIASMLKKYSNNVYGIDIADKMIVVARKKHLAAKLVLGNCLDIPFPDQFFNAIVTRGVLISHVEKDYVTQFIQESKRVLSPGGLFIFDFITQYNESEKQKLKKKAIFNQPEIAALLKKNGFKIIAYSGSESNRVNAVACIKE